MNSETFLVSLINEQWNLFLYLIKCVYNVLISVCWNFVVLSGEHKGYNNGENHVY